MTQERVLEGRQGEESRRSQVTQLYLLVHFTISITLYLITPHKLTLTPRHKYRNTHADFFQKYFVISWPHDPQNKSITIPIIATYSHKNREVKNVKTETAMMVVLLQSFWTDPAETWMTTTKRYYKEAC